VKAMAAAARDEAEVLRARLDALEGKAAPKRTTKTKA
jgi:BMFP domain-containing protein YqiC